MNSNIFTLKSADVGFSQRQKDVFDQLIVLEQNRKNTNSNVEAMETDQSQPRKTQRSFTKHFRGKESIFKQPQDRAPRNFIRNIPDFKKNPHKWKKYSLSDVRDEDISDRGNTNAALSFLNELKHRKELEEPNASSNVSMKILFKRTGSHKKQKHDDEDVKPSFQSSKMVMPEYVVGQKIKKDKTGDKSTKREDKKQQLKLEHLFANEDE